MVVEQRMECVVADPRFVPQHVVAQVPDPFEHLLDVVDGAVVRRELDAREAERTLRVGAGFVGDQRIVADLVAQVFLVPRIPVDGADHAERVARGRHEDRNRAGLHERTLVQRLVVVAVEQHEIAALQHRAGDDLVRRARAVQHEVRAVGAEHAGRVLLRFGRGAFVDQQIAEIDIGIAEVVAEDRLAEVFEEELSRRRFLVELAALMTRAVERHRCIRVIRHQSAEERRQQAHAVFDDARDDLLRIERGRLLAEIDVAVDFAETSDTARSEI